MKNSLNPAPFRLDGKITVVTGAASGIGAAIAALFVRAGARVFLCDRDAEGVRRQALECGGEAIAMDLASEEDCARTAETVAGSAGTPDILVNNAGVGGVGTLLETTTADLDRMYEVNVKGVFRLSKVFLPGMVARGSGTIINLASVGGLRGIRDRVAYCTTKFAVVGLTKSMALDHAAAGVRVNCICPGRVETPFVQARLREYPDPEEARREMESTQMLGRMIQPEEVAAAALYLAADESRMITGTALSIDGGWNAAG